MVLFRKGLWPFFLVSILGFTFLCLHTGTNYIFGMLFLFALVVALLMSKTPKLQRQSVLCLLILFTYITTSFLFFSYDHELTLLSSIPIICLALGVFIASIFSSEKTWGQWILSVAYVASVINAIPVVSFFIDSKREDGVFLDANLSAFFSLIVIYLLVVSLSKDRKKTYLYLAVLVNCLCFAVAFSRFGVIVFFVLVMLSLSLTCFFCRPMFKVYLRVYLIAFFALMVVNFYTVVISGESFFGSPESNIANLGKRLPIYLSVLDILDTNTYLDNVFGRGLGVFQALYPQFRSEFISSGNFVHNDWLQYFLEGGIFGVCFLLFFWVLLFSPVLKMFWWSTFGKKSDKIKAFFVLENNRDFVALFCIVCAVFFNTVVNYSMYSPVLLFILGVIFPRWFAFFTTDETKSAEKKINHTVNVKLAVCLKFLLCFYGCLLIVSMLITVFFVSVPNKANEKIAFANALNSISPGLNTPSNYLLEKIASAIDYQSQPQQIESIDYGLRLTSDLIASRPYSAYAYYYHAYFMNIAIQLKKENRFSREDIWSYLTDAIRVDPSYFPAYTALYNQGDEVMKRFVIESLVQKGYCWLKFYKGDHDIEMIYGLIPKSMPYIETKEERSYLQHLYDGRQEGNHEKYKTNLLLFISVSSCSKLSRSTIFETAVE